MVGLILRGIVRSYCDVDINIKCSSSDQGGVAFHLHDTPLSSIPHQPRQISVRVGLYGLMDLYFPTESFSECSKQQ